MPSNYLNHQINIRLPARLTIYKSAYKSHINQHHTEKRNAKITQILVIFTFDHGLCMHHSLKIVKITLELLVNLY